MICLERDTFLLLCLFMIMTSGNDNEMGHCYFSIVLFGVCSQSARNFDASGFTREPFLRPLRTSKISLFDLVGKAPFGMRCHSNTELFLATLYRFIAPQNSHCRSRRRDVSTCLRSLPQPLRRSTFRPNSDSYVNLFFLSLSFKDV